MLSSAIVSSGAFRHRRAKARARSAIVRPFSATFLALATLRIARITACRIRHTLEAGIDAEPIVKRIPFVIHIDCQSLIGDSNIESLIRTSTPIKIYVDNRHPTLVEPEKHSI